MIFVDLGGGNARVDELEDVIIIDHHQTDGIGKLQANPLLFGIDGGDELSAAGTAYMVFRRFPELGVVGACGDMQAPLRGMNRMVLEEGVRAGRIRIENDLRLYGRYSRPIVQFLAFCDDPFLPGISFREDNAMKMLIDLGITSGSGGDEKTYSDLGEEEKRALVSRLSAIVPKGRDPLSYLIGESYILLEREKDETYEANEFSTLLNACGRHGKPDIGLRVCMGDKEASAEARALLLEHRRMLRAGVQFARENSVDLGPFMLVDGRGVIDEGIIGIVCGMIGGQFGKPMIGISTGENDTIKVSGRAQRSLIEKGLDLGDMMKKASIECGGAGGGHRMAAGASIPKGKINGFLLFVGRYLDV